MDDTKGDKCTVGQANTNSSVFYLGPGEGKMEGRVLFLLAKVLSFQ
jgi:hypothetical protein